MSDTNFLKRIMLGVAGRAILFRNNVALAWTGEMFKPTVPTTVRVGPNDVLLRNARPLHAGLVKGSSDLIGWTPYVAVETDVGRRFAVFTALEAKEGSGRMTDEQKNFVKRVKDAGGYAGEVRSVEQAVEIVSGQVSA